MDGIVGSFGVAQAEEGIKSNGRFAGAGIPCAKVVVFCEFWLPIVESCCSCIDELSEETAQPLVGFQLTVVIRPGFDDEDWLALTFLQDFYILHYLFYQLFGGACCALDMYGEADGIPLCTICLQCVEVVGQPLDIQTLGDMDDCLHIGVDGFNGFVCCIDELYE